MSNTVTTLNDIQEEARRVYGFDHFIKFENSSRGASVRVGTQTAVGFGKANEICCESWYFQQALDAALGALKALPSDR